LCTAQQLGRPGIVPVIRRSKMRMFEAATSMVLAVAAQALAVGVILAL
jgi:hypothetical protein